MDFTRNFFRIVYWTGSHCALLSAGEYAKAISFHIRRSGADDIEQNCDLHRCQSFSSSECILQVIYDMIKVSYTNIFFTNIFSVEPWQCSFQPHLLCHSKPSAMDSHCIPNSNHFSWKVNKKFKELFKLFNLFFALKGQHFAMMDSPADAGVEAYVKFKNIIKVN